MNYSYLSDGTKTRALKANGSGLLYRGPFVYRRCSDGSLTFESASFSGGRLTSVKLNGDWVDPADYINGELQWNNESKTDISETEIINIKCNDESIRFIGF